MQPGLALFSRDPLLCKSVMQPHPMPHCVPFSKLQGTVFDEIFDSNDTVAVGNFVTQADEKRWKVEILSRFCMPIGKRKIIPLSRNPVTSPLELKSQGVKWIVWDSQVPMPGQLAQLPVIEETYYGFKVIKL
jgi:hypothetical protein